MEEHCEHEPDASTPRTLKMRVELEYVLGLMFEGEAAAISKKGGCSGCGLKRWYMAVENLVRTPTRGSHNIIKDDFAVLMFSRPIHILLGYSAGRYVLV